MSTDSTKMMQEALQAAVTRMNNGTPAEPPPAPTDTIGAVLAVLPKLMRGNEPSEEMLEKLEALQTGGLTPLHQQVRILRKQCKVILKFQERLLAKVAEMQRQQSLVADAVLDLAQQMARITFLDDTPARNDDYEREAARAADRYRGAESQINGNGRGRSPRENQ